jgi:hypothetical protein
MFAQKATLRKQMRFTSNYDGARDQCNFQVQKRQKTRRKHGLRRLSVAVWTNVKSSKLLTVEVWAFVDGQGNIIGTLTCDGEKITHAGHSIATQRIATTRIFADGEYMDRSREPERFVRNLHVEYRATRIGASKAVES